MPPTLTPDTPTERHGVLEAASHGLKSASVYAGHFRKYFMPAGLFALVCLGVHAAADAVDDRILWVADGVDAVLDAVLARWSATAPAVDWVGVEETTLFARAITLLWELTADLVLAWPTLGYREEVPSKPRRPMLLQTGTTWKVLLKRTGEKPTTLRILRPLVMAAVVLAGACAIAKLVQGSVFFAVRDLVGPNVGDPAARLCALGTLALVIATLGWRAVLRNLQWVDQISDKRVRGRFQALVRGSVGSALLAPLGVAALIDAAPLLSFFR